jgi:hypothetical protein
MISLRDILRPGITGTVRWRGNHVEAIGADAVRSFRTACHGVARRLNARVIRDEPPETGRNYHMVGLTLPMDAGSFELLLHAMLPYVGARSFPPGADHAEFIDVPFEAHELHSSLMLLPGALLSSRLVIEPWMEACVDPAAWKDIRHWRPELVGDLVFNHYD